MKTKTLIVVLTLVLGMIIPTEMLGQSICGTKFISDTNKNSSTLHSNTGSFPVNGTLCLNVEIYKVTKTNGDFGPPNGTLSNQVNLLNSFFAGTNIHFEWDGTIESVKSDNVYDNYMYNPSNPDFSPFPNSTNIDIYFFDRDVGASFTNGIGSQSQIVIKEDHLSSKIIAHEMGHVLGLFHTYHSTTTVNPEENNDGFSSHIPECPDGTPTERNNSGDYVGDTEADLGEIVGSNPNLDCVQYGSDGDGCFGGAPYNAPPTANFMAGYETCMSEFSLGQRQRMRYFIAGPSPLSHLTAAIGSCPVDQCADCGFDESRATQVFNSLKLNNFGGNECKYQLNIPELTVLCGSGNEALDTYLIEWNGQSGFIGPDGLFDTSISTTYNSPGEYIINITPYRNGVSCGTSYPYTFCHESSCAIIECTACTNCSDLNADFSYTLDDGCPSNFDGSNAGNDCNGQSYEWTITEAGQTDILFQTSQQDFDTSNFTFPEAGNYDVSFTITRNLNGGGTCSDTHTEQVTISTSCVPGNCIDPCPFTPTVDVVIGSGNCQYEFTANLGFTGDVCGTLSYDWSFSNTDGDYPNAQTINPQFNGTFFTRATVWVTYREGLQTICKVKAMSRWVRINCGFGREAIQLKLAPNPVQGGSEITFEGIDPKEINSIQAFDLFGNKKTSQRQPDGNTFKFENFSTGIYIIRFTTNMGIINKTLVVD